jgi:hypothetical protein
LGPGQVDGRVELEAHQVLDCGQVDRERPDMTKSSLNSSRVGIWTARKGDVYAVLNDATLPRCSHALRMSVDRPAPSHAIMQ